MALSPGPAEWTRDDVRMACELRAVPSYPGRVSQGQLFHLTVPDCSPCRGHLWVTGPCGGPASLALATLSRRTEAARVRLVAAGGR